MEQTKIECKLENIGVKREVSRTFITYPITTSLKDVSKITILNKTLKEQNICEKCLIVNDIETDASGILHQGERTIDIQSFDNCKLRIGICEKDILDYLSIDVEIEYNIKSSQIIHMRTFCIDGCAFEKTGQI
jgi:hypothetical protein